MIIPKEHVSTLIELESMAIVAEIFEVLRQLIERSDLEASAFRIVSNGGEYQESKHLHFHLLSPAEATERV